MMTEEELDKAMDKFDVEFGPDPEDTKGNPDEMEVQVPFCGLYESIICDLCDRRREYDEEYYRESLQSEGFDKDDFDLGLWLMDMETVYDEWIDNVTVQVEEWNGIIVPMRFANIWSPREYNFDTDHLHAWVKKTDMRALIEYVLNNVGLKKELDELVREKATPSSGYIPFYDEEDYDWSRDDLPPCMYELIFMIAIPECLSRLDSTFDDRITYHDDIFYPDETLRKIYEQREKDKQNEQ